MKRIWLGFVTGAVLFASLMATAQERTPGEVKQLGRTVAQFKDGTIQIVIGYRYSSAHLDTPWIFLDTNVTSSTGKVFSIHREDVTLLTPSGKELTLPSQKTFGEGFTDIDRVMRMADPFRDPVADYFPFARLQEKLRFFAVPGRGTVLDEFSVSHSYLVSGDLFFTSPSGKFDPGVYTLVIKNRDVDAKLPFKMPGEDLKPEKKDDKTVPW